MQAAKTDENKPSPEVGLAFSRNRVAVLDDHVRYKEAAARYSLGAAFEVVLETGYDLTPQPVAPEAIEEMTSKAVEALAEERASAGGRPLDTAAFLPEPELGELASEEAADDSEAPEALPPPTFGGAGGQDLALLAEYLEARLGSSVIHRINQIDGALAGLGYRLKVVSSQMEQVTQALRESATTGGSLPPAARPPEPASVPAVPPPPEVAQNTDGMSLAQRRDLRRRGGQVPEPGNPKPGAPRPGVESPVPLPEAKRKWPSEPPRWLVPSMVAAAAFLVSLGVWGHLAGPDGPGSAALVVKQAQGLGAYVRAEERALRGCRTPSQEEFLRARSQVLASEGPDRDIAQQRLTSLVREAEASAKAQRALTVLYQVSGITPEGR